MVKIIAFFVVLTAREGILVSFGSVALFFLILLISGIRKTKKLNEANRKLMESIELNLKEDSKQAYKDFTESHSYSNNQHHKDQNR